MATAVWQLKIYEVNGGTETYKWDQDWFVPWDEYRAGASSSNQTTAARVKNAIGMPECSVFYINDPIMSISYQEIKQYSKRALIDTYIYAGKTIKCVLKNDPANRYFYLTFSSVTRTADQVSMYLSQIRFVKDGYDSGNISVIDLSVRNWRDNLNRYEVVGCTFKSNAVGQNVNKYTVGYTSANGYYGNRETSTTTYNNAYKTWISGITPVIPDDNNPYWNGGISGPSDSEGGFGENSDIVDLDQLPGLSVLDTGFATLFTPSKTQLKALSDVMWGSNFIAFLQNMVENIKDMFTSLAIVPFNVDAGSTVEVTWFGLAITEVFLTLCANQYYEFDMGSINLSADDRIFTSGSALDYAPFSKLGIFLPFIGFQELDVDECRDRTINLNYRIDVLSGTCVATIKIDGNAIYQFTGNCLTQIPITSQNMESLVSDAVNVGISVSSLASTAASAGGDIAAAANSESGLQYQDVAEAHKAITRSEGQLASATANAAIGMKPQIKKGGAVSASASLLSVRQPYLFLTTPHQSMPDHYQRYCGFPCNITGKLSTFSGFTVVEDIRLNGLVATSPEVAEIYELLKKGVII